MITLPDTKFSRWPLWSWVLSLVILLAGSFISYYLRNFTDSLLLYLSLSFAIVLVHWFGLHILPLVFINGLFTLWLWDAQGSLGYLILLTSKEPIVVFTSWLLGKRILLKDNGFSNTKSFIGFVMLGIIVPNLVNSLYAYHYSFVDKDFEKVVLIWLSDFITIFSVSIPLLHFLKPVATIRSLRLTRQTSLKIRASTVNIQNLVMVTILFVGLSFVIDFSRYWFVYGIMASLVAVRNGFETVIIVNSVIYFLNYILPLTEFGDTLQETTQNLNVHLGMGTMYFVSSLIGRTVGDLLDTDAELKEQKKLIEHSNEKLTKANQEMDRFVYSVSHDISAPLKSILGLINLSRIENKASEVNPYLDKIEQSTRRLEDFVAEILDHSKTNRKEIQMENILLHEKVWGIIEGLKYLDIKNSTKFTVAIPDDMSIMTDKFLLKVALSNIISNAIKYQKIEDGHIPEINIIASSSLDHITLKIQDNGQGIPDHNKSKIFDMFYRATTLSSGSGLGLYIAKEAIERLQGNISFESTFGMGTTFTIHIPIPMNSNG